MNVYAVAITTTKDIKDGFNIQTYLNAYAANSTSEAIELAKIDSKKLNPEHEFFSAARVEILPEALMHPMIRLLQSTDSHESSSKVSRTWIFACVCWCLTGMFFGALVL